MLIYGAGAVGSLLGGILAGAGYAVTLLGRRQSLQAIERDGLTVQVQHRLLRTYPRVVHSFKEIDEPFDVVLLTLRAFGVESALAGIPPVLGKDGVLLSLQNGIGTEELIERELPDVYHVAGSLTLSADIPSPGLVTSSSRSGGIALAAVSPGAPVEWTAELFRGGDVPVSVHRDARSMKWSKLLLNQMANGIPAILDWTPGQLYRHPHVFQIELALLRETLRVIQADGASLVLLPGFNVPLLRWVLAMPPWIARRLLLSRVEGGRGEKLPSLLIDLRAGRRKIEARWLYGAVAECGDRLGVPAPLNRRVHRILDAIAVNPDLRAAFRNRPDRLTRNIVLRCRE